VYIDFSKALDSVVHSKLLAKLESYGITGKLLLWLQDFLSDRTQAVKIGTNRSCFTSVLSGVPQGSVLGPLMFLLFINDIVDVLGPDLTVKLYADDIKLYSLIDNIGSTDVLQRGLSHLCNWCTLWQMTINVNKCYVLHMGHSYDSPLYVINDIALRVTDVANDLGVQVDSKL